MVQQMIHYVLCFFFFFGVLSADEIPEKHKTVCLNMIVKNETRVIRRCLDSVRPMIDYWVIVDTGSTDGTQEMIKEYMKDVPGELHERSWINFGHNRNEALQLAKGKADYTLFIDADEVLVYEKDFKLPPLKADFYYIMTHFGGTNYARVQLIKDTLDWKWKGVLHEAVDSSDAKTSDVLIGVYNDVHTDGARSQDPDKYKKDIQTLEAALRDEPNNTRYVFYLAQSYRDAKEDENSLKYYRQRINMGGWDEEVFWSMIQAGILETSLDKPQEVFLETWAKAHLYRPTRIEPLYYMANYHRTKGQYAQGYILASLAVTLPKSEDLLFVQQWMYDYAALLELSICCYWVGRYEEFSQTSHQLLANPNLPDNVRQAVEKNLTFLPEAIR